MRKSFLAAAFAGHPGEPGVGATRDHRGHVLVGVHARLVRGDQFWRRGDRSHRLRVDDNSNAFANAVDLLGISIDRPRRIGRVPGNGRARSPTIPIFRNYWSGSPTGLTGVQVGSYTGAGLSLSGTSGDAVQFFNAVDAVIASVTFPASPAPSSFGYNPTTMTFGAKSVAGQFGAFNSAGSPTDIGSPGTIGVPEPGAIGLIGLALAGLAGGTRGRRRVAQAVKVPSVCGATTASAGEEKCA